MVLHKQHFLFSVWLNKFSQDHRDLLNLFTGRKGVEVNSVVHFWIKLEQYNDLPPYSFEDTK